MGTKKQVHFLLISAVSVMLLGFYQQCAPAKFNGFTDPASKTDGNGVPVDGNGNPIPGSGEIPNPTPTPAPPPNPNVPGPILPGNTNTVARAKCMDSLKQGAPLIVEKKLTGNGSRKGYLVVQTRGLDHVSGVNGELVIWGIGNSARIGKITGLSGTLVLCGIDVSQIMGIPGNLYLTAGSIDNVQGTSGNVYVTDGSVNNVHNLSGRIEIKNGNVTQVID